MLFGKHVNRYYVKHAPMLLLGILALVLVDYFQLEIPELYGLVVNGTNAVIKSREAAAEGITLIPEIMYKGEMVVFNLDFVLDKICLPMIIVIVSLVIGRFLWRISFFGTAIKVEADLRLRMFDRCKILSEDFYQTNKVGSLMSLFTNDLETIHESFGSGILMLFDAVLLGALALYKMIRLSWQLTIITLIPMALLLVVATIVGKYMKSKWRERQEAFSTLSDFAQENFSGIAVVKAFVKEFRELLAFRRINKHNENANVAYTKASTLLNVFVTLFVESVVCIILGVGGYLVYTGGFSDAGMLIEFMSYFVSIIWPVMAVSNLIEMSSRASASYGRIAELLDTEPSVKDKENAQPLVNPKGKIEFKNLSFSHPYSDSRALKNVSFTIEAGEHVGIVGRTGAGKTTVADLILRVYNAPEGTLFIDGADVNSITLKSVRDAMAYVPQDNFLFSDTIEHNIAFGVGEYTQEDITRVAKLADVHSNITEFKEEYKTVLGERGVTVSGGQKQRISIARALLRDASILILDDSVSAVDTDTERVILSNIAKYRHGRTTILIAHRISTVENMDKIIYIDDGRVIAVGKHEELYDTCQGYRNMVNLQKLDSEAD